MAKNPKQKDSQPLQAEPSLQPQVPSPKYQSSGTYMIRKYGLYAYQTFKVSLDGEEKKMGEPNTYGVVASDLIDLIFKDLNKGLL